MIVWEFCLDRLSNRFQTTFLSVLRAVLPSVGFIWHQSLNKYTQFLVIGKRKCQKNVLIIKTFRFCLLFCPFLFMLFGGQFVQRYRTFLFTCRVESSRVENKKNATEWGKLLEQSWFLTLKKNKFWIEIKWMDFRKQKDYLCTFQ